MTAHLPWRIAAGCGALCLLVLMALSGSPAGGQNPFAKLSSPWQILEMEKADKADVPSSKQPPAIKVEETHKRYLVLTVRFKQMPKDDGLKSFRLIDAKSKKPVGTFAGHNGNKDREGKEGIVDLTFEGSWNELKGIALTGAAHREDLVKEAKPETTDKKDEKKVDPGPTGVDAENQAASSLKLAKYYLENKKPDKAKEKLQYILDKFPKTESAAEARKLMKQIK